MYYINLSQPDVLLVTKWSRFMGRAECAATEQLFLPGLQDILATTINIILHNGHIPLIQI